MSLKYMPFGKYKGWPVDEMPLDYLNWLIDNIELREPLASAVYQALQEQWQETRPQHTRGSGADVKAIYRRLAIKWHPDHGGSNEAMQAVNEFYEMLTKSE